MNHTHIDEYSNINEVDSIVFSADITNEEAYILQQLKEKDQKKLISPEAKKYQAFLEAYSSSSNFHICKGDLDTLNNADVVISIGVWFQAEEKETIKTVQEILKQNAPQFVYMHPIEDASLQNNVTQFIKYEVGSEEGVSALLAYTLLENKALPQEIEDLLEELDIGYLSAESNVGEEELEAMYEMIGESATVSLILGSDLYTHSKADQIAKLLGLLEKYAGVNVVCLPPEKNALGIAMICQLDDRIEGKNVVYESCQEGTYVDANRCLRMDMDVDKRTFDAIGLNHLGNTVALHQQSILDYTNQLPQEQGFQKISNDEMKQTCIYKLSLQERKETLVLDETDDLPVYDGALVYTYQVESHDTKKGSEAEILYGSKQFAMATKLQDGDLISFEVNGIQFTRVFKIDTHMKGVIALNPVCDIKLSAFLLSSYRFSRLAFEKINNQNIGNNDE